METTAQLLPPRYRDAEPIANGGMGEVYRATDTTLERDVAVKILAAHYAADASVRERFTREALAAARLSSDPSIVTIFDVGEWDGRPYIVMEYLGGGSLEQRLSSEGAQAPAQALAWLEQAARALDRAHAEGVVHRDIKPGNLLLDPEENVHVADFGIASATGMQSLTMTGTVLGTAGYLSPEQAQGERATPASDRYALGVVAYELLTGTRPFASETPTAEATAHVNAEVPSVGERTRLPLELDDVFRKALAKDPARRYATGADFVAALRHALDTAAGPTLPLAAVAPAAVRRAALWPLLVAALAAAALAGIVLAAVLSGGAPKTTAASHKGAKAQTTNAPATTAAAPAPNGHQLNDQAYALMQQGNWAQAVPLLQSAVHALQGSGPGDPYEGYANYNLGYSLLQLGRCQEAATYLQRAGALEPGNKDVRHALKAVEHCGKGNGGSD
jgi:serine/threonine-protein kinase